MKKILVFAFTMVVLAVSVLGLFNEPQKVEAAFSDGDYYNHGNKFFNKKNTSTPIKNWWDFVKGDTFEAIILTNVAATENFGGKFVYGEFRESSKYDNGVQAKYGKLDRSYCEAFANYAIWHIKCIGLDSDGNTLFTLRQRGNPAYGLDQKAAGDYVNFWAYDESNPNQQWIF